MRQESFLGSFLPQSSSTHLYISVSRLGWQRAPCLPRAILISCCCKCAPLRFIPAGMPQIVLLSTVAPCDVAEVDLREKQYRTSCRDGVRCFKESLEGKKEKKKKKLKICKKQLQYKAPPSLLISICAGVRCKCLLSSAVLPDVRCSTELLRVLSLVDQVL